MSSSSSSPYTVIYSFGDSLSDAGDAYLLTTSTLASSLGLAPEPVSPPYYQETYGTIEADVFGNGPVWVQDLAGSLDIAAPAPGEIGLTANDLKSVLESTGLSAIESTLLVNVVKNEDHATGADPYLELVPGVPGGTDFAIGGSVSGPSGFNTGAQSAATDLASQLANFEAEVGTPSPTALYTVWSGSNDLLNLVEAPNFNQLLASGAAAVDVTDSVNNEIAMVESLVALGAQNVLVLNVPDLGTTPEIAIGTTLAGAATALAESFDQQLATDLALDNFGSATVTLEDTFTLIDSAILNPGSYGLTNVTDPVYSGSFTSDNGTLVSTDPTVQDQYLFFDELHPTETGQSFIAAEAEALLAACFAQDTRIATPSGTVPVETLQPGDLVQVMGGTAPVGWIGRRQLNLSGCAARPIRIQAGAVGPGLPARDLVVSPEHAVFLQGALVPARALCGCRGIAAASEVDRITYFHIALDRHAILFAEGLACESWLDTGNRAMFENAPTAGACPTIPCAERLESGPALDRLRLELGAARTQELRLDRAGTHEISIAPGTGAIRLASPHGQVPGDRRRLGVALSALALDDQLLALDDPRLASGFHAPEAAWRWTDGAALLTIMGARKLRVDVVALV